jgi:hypothetical protein
MSKKIYAPVVLHATGENGLQNAFVYFLGSVTWSLSQSIIFQIIPMSYLRINLVLEIKMLKFCFPFALLNFLILKHLLEYLFQHI